MAVTTGEATTGDRATRRLSFGPAAEAYDRLRPPYPAEALRWALGERPLRVVDLGAGTGILTRAVLALGHHVTAVEPDARMRAHLQRVSPQVTTLDGRAERIPLPDAAADAVVAGQAYHWFDPVPAHAEIARVLRPGGVLVPLWNVLDLSVPWQAELTRVSEDDTAGRGLEEPVPEIGSLGPAYGQVQRRRFRHAVWHTPDTLVGLVATRSYYLTAPPARQREIDRRVRHLCATHPDLAGRDRFPLRYLTVVYRVPTVTRPDSGAAS